MCERKLDERGRTLLCAAGARPAAAAAAVIPSTASAWRRGGGSALAKLGQTSRELPPSVTASSFSAGRLGGGFDEGSAGSGEHQRGGYDTARDRGCGRALLRRYRRGD